MPKRTAMILALGATVLCGFVLCARFTSTANAQSTSSAVAPAQAQAQPQKITAYTLPPDELAKAKGLYETRTVLYLFGMVFDIVLLWVLLKLRIAPALRGLAERAGKNSFLQTLIFVPLLGLFMALIVLPIDIYGHHISLAYGLSVQGWESWAADWGKGQAVLLVIAVPAVFALFRIVRRSPQRWWFYFWLLTLPFLFLFVFVAPVILDPMFNTFEPLETTQPQLVSEIEKVVHRTGMEIPRSRMFEMKASEKVTTYNAYVTGIGATKRVVVWDNTARDMTIPETLFIFGHEMGHYVLNHIYKGLAFGAALMLAGFWLGSRMVSALLSRWGAQWGIRDIHDLAALPVLLLTLSLLAFVGEPIGNAFSRHIEHQADIYGLEVTHGLFPDNNHVAAASFQKLGEESYDYPTPNRLLVFWSYTHPSIAERVQFALHYNPWDTPSGPKYVK